jgi:uncharacterized protein (DUF433 family)
MHWQDRIVIDPDILVGKPAVKDTRLAVEFIIDLMAQVWSESEILRNYPGIAQEDVKACLAYASAALQGEKVYPCETERSMRILIIHRYDSWPRRLWRAAHIGQGAPR